jgi:hypothetical protein
MAPPSYSTSQQAVGMTTPAATEEVKQPL